MALSAGSSLGSYRIAGALGAGGMGEVYRAHDPRLGRDVALKVLPAEMASDPARLERFTREARAIAALNHPHIVTIYTTEDADGIRFLTMELVDGQPLDALIPATGLPLARFLELALPLADALTAAHAKQITHRDLKPANVMVTTDGRVKVLDFGLARVGGPLPTHQTIEATRPILTSEGTIVGTMPYMSPEQIEGKSLDHRTDLFSLGVMFHEMLTGSRPFTGESSPQLMSSILRDVPASASDLRTEVPDALSRLIHRCLEKRADDRVQTARDIYNELRHVQKQLESGSSRRKSDSASAPATAPESLWIAVLPFTTRTSDPDSLTLADGLTEDVTAGLSLFPSLSVIALQTARGFKDSPLDARQIAERLNARYIMSGSVRKSGSGIRIAVHLIDAHSGTQLWSETFDRRLENADLYAIQDELTDRVVSTVADKAGVLARSMAWATQGIPSDRLSANQLVHRCWGFEARPTPAEHAELRAALETFVARQPHNAELWAELANSYLAEHCLLYNPLPDPLGRALRGARRAVEVDRTNQRGWVVLAMACFFNRDDAGFQEAAGRVLALNPRNSNALAWIGTLTAHTGHCDRGCALVERAMSLNSAHPGWYHFAIVNRDVARREFQDALRAARRVNVPDFMWMHLAIAAAAGQLGLAAEGRAAVEAMEALAPPLANDDTLHEFLTRWFWDEAVVEDLVEGVRRSKLGIAEPVKKSIAWLPASAGRATPDDDFRLKAEATKGANLSSGTSSSASDRAVALSLRVAVCPFTSDAAAASLAEGLTDAITTGLSRFSYVRVFAGAATGDARAAGRSLGAGYVLDGAVRTAGDTMRVSARLIDVDSGTHLWAEQYDRTGSASDLFAVQADLASRIVATLADGGGVLERALTAALKRAPAEHRGNADLWLRFGEYVEHFTAARHLELRSGFEALVARDPSNADAWAYLSVLYGHELFFAFNPLPDPLQRLRTAAERALVIDVTSQGGWYALAEAALFERNAAELTTAAERALELNPLHSRTAGAIGLFYAFSGDTARGAALVNRAISLNPRYPGWFHIALFLHAFHTGDAAGALAHAARINMPHLPVDGRLFAIAAAGRFGRANEAAAGLDVVARTDASLLDPRRARDGWAVRIWEGELLDGLVDGFEKALALTGRSPQPSAIRNQTASSDALSGAIPQPASPLSSDRASEAGALAIAVRLFTARGGDSATELAEGLSEDVTTGLSRFSYLRVVPRASVEGTAAAPARYVLEGQVRRAASTVRVSARLIDTMSGAQLWAENYDRSADTDVFQMQDDIASRIVATVADANGVMLRSMVATLRQRPVAMHTVSELVVRFHGFLEHFDRAEHRHIRDQLAAALEREPGHADGWACLSSLIEHEYSHGLNPLPDSLRRARETAERSIAANPVCQEGWRAMTSTAFFARDGAGVDVAAERAIAINSLNTGTVAVCGLFLCYRGAWDRGLEVIRQAMQPNPHYPGWLHIPVFSYHYNRHEFEDALQQAKRINMPYFPKALLCMAGAAGQMGLREEARAALDAVAKLDPEAVTDEYARRAYASWLWTDAELDHMLDGLRKARALVASGALATPAGAAGSNDRAIRTGSGASIAVLPFADLSPEKNQDWFCDGIAEEILNALTQLPGLHVAARTSTFSLRNSADDLRAVGEKLGVATVVQGSVRRAGDRIRVTVQLVDVSNAFQLWSDRYDRELKDIFDVQDEIARAVANRLKLALPAGRGHRLVAATTSNLDAYELYLKGRALIYRRGGSILPALDSFRRAVELDAEYAPAWAGIAESYVVCGFYGLIRGPEVRRQGLAAARRALALDPSSADAHTALACLRRICEDDIEGAGVALGKTLELNPSHVQARCWYSLFYLQAGLGRYDEGVAEARRAQTLDPLSAYTASILAVALITAGRTTEGVEEARKAVAIDPHSFVARWILGMALLYDGRLDEAESVSEQAAAISNRHHYAIIILAVTLARKGDRDRARTLHAELVKRAAEGYIPLTQLALSADAAGDREQALAYARQALDEREPPFLLLARHWPDFIALRQDPRFAALVRELDDTRRSPDA